MPSQFGGVEVSNGSRFGGVPVETPAQVENPETAAAGFWQNVNPAPFLKMVSQAASSPASLLGPAGTTAELLRQLLPAALQSHKEQLQKAVEANDKGNHVEAFGHLLGGLVPLLGPVAAHAAETMGGTEAKFDKYGNILEPGMKPNLPGGLGEAAGLLLPSALGAAAERLRPLSPPVVRRAPAPNASAQAVIDAGNAHAVPVSYGDATAKPIVQRAEQMLEKVPIVGTSGFREGQQTAAKTAAENMVTKAHERFLDTDAEEVADIQKAAANGDGRARELLDTIQTAGNDPARTQQASIGISDWRTRQQAKAFYDRLENLVEKHQLGDVDVSGTLSAIDRALGEESGAKIPDEQLIGLLRKIKKNLSPREVDASTLPVPNAETPARPGGTTQEGAANGKNVQTGSENRGPGERPPVPEQAGTGQETTVKVPGQTKGYQAQYAVRELEDIQASHNGQSFEANKKYPFKNDRDYTREENQGKVVQGSGEQFDSSYHITDNPDATNGPIVVDPEGNALGGNGRTMILQRVYGSNPKGAAAYRQLLEAKAEQFGLDPETIRGMKQPVLVRELADHEITGQKAAQDAITDFNKKGTAALTPAEQALADARRVSPGTMEDIGRRLEAKGPEATLAQVLEGKSGGEVLDKLINDGVITSQDRAGLQAGPELTAAGKDRISKLLLGRFFSDPKQFDAVSATVRNNLERIAAPLAKVESTKGYNLTEHVKEAVDLIAEARAHGGTLEDFLNQKGLLADQEYAPEVVTLAKALSGKGAAAELSQKANQFAEHAKYASEYQGPGLMDQFPEPKTGGQAFNEVFGGKTSPGRELSPIEPRTVPQPSAAFSDTFKTLPPIQTGTVTVPADNSYGRIRELRSDLGEMIREQMVGKNSIIGGKVTARLQPVQSAIEADLNALARNSGVPEVAKALDVADEYYRTARVPFRDPLLTSAARSTEPDRIFQQFIQANGRDRAQKFYDVLDAKGREAVKFNIVQRAVDQATNGRTGVFSPAQFFNHLEKIKEAYGVFFKGADRMEMDGFKNLMGHVVRAGQYAENPATGQRLIEPAMYVGATAAAMHAPVSLATVAGVAALARGLFTTAPGRDFLMKASAMKPGSKMLGNLVNQSGPLVKQLGSKYTAVPAATQPQRQ